MKKALQRAMITADKKKFKTDFHSFSIRKNAPSLDNVDSLAVPEEFLVISKTVDRVALLKAGKRRSRENSRGLLLSQADGKPGD